MSRVERVTQMLKEEVSKVIHDDLKDPRLGFVTVTRVELTKDLKYAKVYYSIFGSDKEEKSTKEALDNSSGFIRREIARRIQLRFAPEIMFRLDKSAEYSIQIQGVLDQIKELTNESGKGNKTRKKK